MACTAMMHENIWVDRFRVQDAELAYHQTLANQRAGLVVQKAINHCGGGDSVGSDLINEIARARQNIKKTLNDVVGLKVGVGGHVGVDNPELQARLSAVEQENKELKKVTAALQATVTQLTARVTALEKGSVSTAPVQKAAPTKTVQQEDDDDDDDDDDDFDLFGAGNEEEEAKVKEQRQQVVEEKKKPPVIAKSSIVLDVKPWDDETDMKAIENHVRTIQTDGLVWGASKLVPVGYGIKKLQIMCVVEDDKVGTDYLEEKITAFEDLIQSVDIAAFNKI